MSLHLHRAVRADHLVDALAEVLRADPLPDPFAAEVVAVPTPGVERWLAQRLSAHLGTGPSGTDGVCAGVEFPSLTRLLERVTAPPPSDETVGAGDPWHPRRAVWPLLRVIDGCRGEAWSAQLWSFLTDDPGGARRWLSAQHLARLFASYAASRPGLLRAWHEGRDVDPAERPLDDHTSWQAELWRRLRAEIGAGPAERTPHLAGDLPGRLSVFGLTRLDADQIAVLRAVAERRELHLWLPHPSPALWDRLRPDVAGRPSAADPRRAIDPTEALVHHPLLRYLGRDVRELQQLLAVAGPVAGDQTHAATGTIDTGPGTLLSQLQHDIAGDVAVRPASERPLLDAVDRSVVFHASHGADRQVEVLREVLVGLLADDPTLEPRDILVMCPDIETYAPLIVAAFGLDSDEHPAEHPGHRLRVRLADRSLGQINPLLAVLTRVLDLAGSRAQASTLVDLCAMAPVAARFRFSVDDLERVQELVSRSGVRWGLDAAHRQPFGMGAFAQNTWAAGLDRLLLGIAMDQTDQQFLGTALPLDEVDSADVELVGRLAEYVHRVRTVVDGCAEPHPAAAWVALLREALELLTSVPSTDAWQQGQAHAELGRLAADAADEDAELSLAEITALLRDTLRSRATRANFGTGTLTVCTMLPMRSVPHRVVCLLGVDDGVFPRRPRIDGDDLAAAEPWVGDRDPRSEDRQLLLDAVLATEERLLVIYAGWDPRTGVARPPAVPIGALLDALDSTARTSDGSPVRASITVAHSLQPFAADNFTVAGGDDEPFSFDRGAWRGARSARGERHEPQIFTAAELPPWTPEPAVELGDLLRFYAHPVRALLRQRALLSFWADDEQPDEQIPAQLGGLDRWAVGERMLTLRLAGHDLPAVAAAEWRRGDLPPRRFGVRALEEIATEVAALAEAAAPYRVGPARLEEILAVLEPAAGTGAAPVELRGAVPAVHEDCLVRVSFSRLSARHRLQAWLELLALSASHPGRSWRAVVVGRGGQCVLGPLPPDWAARPLADLIELRRVGLGGPLPFAPKVSEEYARQRRRSPDRPLAPLWPTLARIWKDERDPAYDTFFPPTDGLDALLAAPSDPAEVLGELAEPSRFGTLARRVFEPLLWIEAQS